MEKVSFAWWKWAVVAILGLLIWQFVRNNDFLAFHLLSATGLLKPGIAPWFPAITTAVALAVALPSFALLYRWPGGGLSRIGLTAEGWRRDALIGLGVGVIQAGLSLLVIIPLLGELADDMLSSVSGLFESPQRILASIVLVLIYGGVIEELFFRGHVITSLGNALGGRKLAFFAATAVSAALFAQGHDYQGWIGMVYGVFATLVWGALFLWTRRLTASIVAHASYDLLTMMGILAFYADKVAAG